MITVDLSSPRCKIHNKIKQTCWITNKKGKVTKLWHICPVCEEEVKDAQ